GEGANLGYENFLSSKDPATPPEPRYFLSSFQAFFWTTYKRRLKCRQGSRSRSPPPAPAVAALACSDISFRASQKLTVGSEFDRSGQKLCLRSQLNADVIDATQVPGPRLRRWH